MFHRRNTAWENNVLSVPSSALFCGKIIFGLNIPGGSFAPEASSPTDTMISSHRRTVLSSLLHIQKNALYENQLSTVYQYPDEDNFTLKKNPRF